ncbi:thiol:disulfide interchange protein DsbA/DsbL [Pseudomonadota bacterium]
MKIRTFLLLALLLPCLAMAGPNAGSFQEGVHYQLLTTPQPTETGDKVEVLELFWYGCPHCFQLEPTIEKWLEHVPEGAEYRRLPAIFSKVWAINAQGYYAAEALGVLDKTHRPLFDAIHVHNQKLFDEASLAAFFVRQGVNREDFIKTFRSFAVKTKTNRAGVMTRRYGITGVPAIIVNGKYRTSVTMAGGEEKVMEVVNALIEKERGN